MTQYRNRSQLFQNQSKQPNLVRLLVAGVCSLIITCVFLFAPAPIAQAKANNVITVNSLTDTVATDGVCNLREAIQSANLGMPIGSCASGVVGLDTINISVNGTINLGSALPDITQDVDIVGPGANLLTISGANSYRPMKVNSGVKMNLSGVTIANGFNAVANGGGLYNSGTMTITATTFFSNGVTSFKYGGGIYNDGILSLSGSTIYSNTSNSSGGGISNNGTMAITNTNIVSNSLSGNSFGGGGIHNTASLSINSSSVNSNSIPSGYGSGIYSSGSLTVTNTSVYSNSINLFGWGGGVYNLGSMLVTNSAIYQNTAKYGLGGGIGGGIYNDSVDKVAWITNTLIYENNAGRNGGGISVYSGPMQIISSTIRSNTAGSLTCSTGCRGGGIFSLGILTMTNSTVNGNNVTGMTGQGDGGGISDSNIITLTNVTISGNSASNTAGGIDFYVGGSLAFMNNVTIAKNSSSANSGGILVSSGRQLYAMNTIIADNTAIGLNPDCQTEGIFNSQDYNLIGNPSGCTISGSTAHNITGQSPKLATLGNYGGPTFTHALMTGSPAINAGNSATCLATDQRGVVRPVDGTCDIGAYEGTFSALSFFLPFIAKQ